MLNFEFSYPFYLTKRTRRTRHAVYTRIKVWQELEETIRIHTSWHTSLAVEGNARMSEGTSSLHRSISTAVSFHCLHNILIRSKGNDGYHTHSNYPNILIVRMAYLMIFPHLNS